MLTIRRLKNSLFCLGGNTNGNETVVAKNKKWKEAKKTGSSSSKTRKQGRSKFAKKDSAQKSCGKIGNDWRGKEEEIG